MRCDEANKFSWRFLPEYREMFLIARHQIIRLRGIGTFKKHIVVRVARHFQTARWGDRMAVIPDQLQQLLAKSLPYMELWT